MVLWLYESMILSVLCALQLIHTFTTTIILILLHTWLSMNHLVHHYTCVHYLIINSVCTVHHNGCSLSHHHLHNHPLHRMSMWRAVEAKANYSLRSLCTKVPLHAVSCH